MTSRALFPTCRRTTAAAVLVLLLATPVVGLASAPTTLGEQGRYVTHLLLHEVGSEKYDLRNMATGYLLTVASTLQDRHTVRSRNTSLETRKDFAPVFLETKRGGSAPGDAWVTRVGASSASIQEAAASRTAPMPRVAFAGFQEMPAALQMMMMRYWLAHHKPRALQMLRADPTAPPVEIRRVGSDVLSLPGGRRSVLTRYTVANLMFGREILWMDDRARVAALMTFAGGLPVEQVLEEYRPALRQLVGSGVRQEMANLDTLGRQVRPEATGTFAIVGARLIDGTGAAPIADSAVIVNNSKIVATGARATVALPRGIKVVHAEGQTLLPGLWEMHIHYSGVEFGPALLAAGITTARDLGGEFEFLTALRRKLNDSAALGPRLLLAGLIDSGGPLAFGEVDVETTAESIAAVDRYADAGFQQIKVYDQIQPDVLRAIAAEAHRRGLIVTGHVPAAVDTFGGIADGMDQINHLQYITREMQEGTDSPVDPTSVRAKRMIALLKERQIVVDPTDSWGEMASHPKGVSVMSFEPGVAAAPFTLRYKYESLGAQVDETRWRERMAANGRAIGALHAAGVPIVAGSDTGLVGYGLDRELELYVAAGMTPIAAIQTATLGAARTMKLGGESGSVEVGKRADLILVEGNPLTNIGDLRRVTKVVRGGWLYDSIALGRVVGFERMSGSHQNASRRRRVTLTGISQAHELTEKSQQMGVAIGADLDPSRSTYDTE
jgi:imidazolonepropionase-like amidohydrolase